MSAKDVTADLKRLLLHRYNAPEWFLTYEIQYGTRAADAVAVSRIDSRGNEVHVIEVKADRSDWLRELASPQKANGWASIADRFYLCADKDVAKPEEIPATWGLLVPFGSGLREVKKAPLLTHWREEGDRVDPIPRTMWVMLLRRTLEDGGVSVHARQEYERGHREGKAAAESGGRWERDRLESELSRLKHHLAEFEGASGIKVDGWDAGNLGKAVKELMTNRSLLDDTRQAARNAARSVKNWKDELKEAGVDVGEDP